MSNIISIEFLKENNLILVDKNALLDLMAENNVLQQVDKRVKYLTVKEACKKYNITRYWLNKNENNLKVIVGNHFNSTKKFNEQSIINELNKQSI